MSKSDHVSPLVRHFRPCLLAPFLAILIASASGFGFGSTPAEVMRQMGSPTDVNSYPSLGEETWSYGFSTVGFRNGLVAEWHDYDGNLKVSAGHRQQDAPPITRGSSKSEVIAAMGTPTGVNSYPSLGEETWSYGFSTVGFRNGVVAEWHDCNGNLKVSVGHQQQDAPPIARGSSKSEVIAAMGTPTGVNSYPSLGEETWSYGFSTVTFRGDHVDGWSNQGNLLVSRELHTYIGAVEDLPLSQETANSYRPMPPEGYGLGDTSWVRSLGGSFRDGRGRAYPYVAENGDIYNRDNDGDGRVEPTYVRGYYRNDGVYVRSHYRAIPRK